MAAVADARELGEVDLDAVGDVGAAADAARAPHTSQNRSVTAAAGSRQIGQIRRSCRRSRPGPGACGVGAVDERDALLRRPRRAAPTCAGSAPAPGAGRAPARAGPAAAHRSPWLPFAVTQLDGRGEERRAHLLGGAGSSGRPGTRAAAARRSASPISAPVRPASVASMAASCAATCLLDVSGTASSARDGRGPVARPQRRAGEPERGVGEARLDPGEEGVVAAGAVVVARALRGDGERELRGELAGEGEVGAVERGDGLGRVR